MGEKLTLGIDAELGVDIFPMNLNGAGGNLQHLVDGECL